MSVYAVCRRVLLVIVLMAGAALSSSSMAQPVPAVVEQESSSRVPRFLRWAVQDAGALVTSVPTRRSLYVLGVGAGLAALSYYDQPLTARAARIQDQGFIVAVEEVGNVKYIRPAAVGLFAGSLLVGSERFQDAAYTSLQAVLFANAITNTLKFVFGRVRPRYADGPMDFQPFSGNTSFPSGHATTAFAFLTPWLMYYPGVGTYGLLLVAGGTAFSRLATNVHWMTDVLAGSTIGFTTGYFLAQRHQRRNPRLRVSPTFGLQHAGLTISF
ncbi:MAG: phosphatase PAP2 family protein [Bacteroidetes bacterium]|nr:MAG: phosphatase PAP2 family protein [Bacteroidota bacterium]